MYLHGKAPTLESPNQKSHEFIHELCDKSMITSSQEKTLNTLKEKFGLKSDTDLKLKKKRKKGGPNPLSCKKKKKKNVGENTGLNGKNVGKSDGKVRKRKRIKLPAHVKEALFGQKNATV